MSQPMPLITGNIVKIWHGNRGHDYIVVAAQKDTSRIGLIRNTCLNNDGTIHKSKLRSMVNRRNRGESIFDSEIDIDQSTQKPGNINRVCGKRMVAPGVVKQLLTAFQIEETWEFVGPKSAPIYPPLTASDARTATQY